ncbi:MAG TPA: chloride channel protein [Symbiobacteriaceae bacterium]|nr:chloride channel protein [Symbiobacteriaceae bacterium]
MGSTKEMDAAWVAQIGLVAMVGALVAVAVRSFEHMAEWLLEMGYTHLPEGMLHLGLPSWAAFLVFPAAIGLAVAAVKRTIPGRDRGHSVPLVIVALTKRNGVITPATTLLKSLGAMLMLGAGGSLGREGPVALLGAGIGSALGQLFHLRVSGMNTLVAAGAGAAIATAFHAPMTGAFFVMEIVLIAWGAQMFAMSALAGMVAVQVSGLLSAGPLLPMPAFQFGSKWEIALYIGLGLAITPLARLYIAVLENSGHVGNRSALPDWAKPALGGLLFGAVAIVLPQTLGGGFGTISATLTGKLSLGLLLLLCVAKLVTIGLTNGSGWPGGVFAPALFLGACAGGAYGALASFLLPGVVTSPGAYAVAGMAAMIAGATHAPLTAMALAFELTQDYRITLLAMLACGIAAIFSERLSRYSVDTVHLPQEGIVLPWQVQDLRSIRIADAMSTSVHTVPPGVSLRDVLDRMEQCRHVGYPVVDDLGRLTGMITLGDIRDVPPERRRETPVASVMSSALATLTPDDSLADAALLLARQGIGRIPIVSGGDPTQLVGLISRSDILKAYPAAEAVQAEPPMEQVHLPKLADYGIEYWW